MELSTRPDWTALLTDAVNRPGLMMSAYTAFHNYSVGNQLLAMWQCAWRGIEPGPISTYKGWLEKGRQVRKGEKAISLWQPFTKVRKTKEEDGTEGTAAFTTFAFKNSWFVLSQTDGEDVEIPTLPTWDAATALGVLGIKMVSFAHTDGNVQGYARPKDKELAINPVAELPTKTLLHEMAHVLLHEEDTFPGETESLPRNLAEVEAEGVALLVSDALGLDGQEYCRGYIQHWLKGNEIPDRNAGRIMKAADQIIRAGHPA